MNALIGHTGFVGSCLRGQTTFSHLYNSRNFREMAGEHFDLVCCAGVAAKKWIANADPQGDRAAISALNDVLGQITARRFVLISTIDVYPDPSQPVDESFDIDRALGQPYGQNRLWLEDRVQAQFDDTLIVRLPALFGTGLRKNALFDLIHDNQVEKINPAGVFQWYPMVRLWQDISLALQNRLKIINLFTEPVAMSEIVSRFFPAAKVGPENQPALRYDVRTRHSALFGGPDGYVLGQDAVLEEMGRFIAQEQASRAA